MNNMTKLNPLIEAMSNIDDALVERAQKTAKAPIRLRTLAVAAAAALTLGATAVGAVAVYSHNVNEEYARVLEYPDFVSEYKWTNLKDNDGNELDENVKAVENRLYEKLNIELDQTFECDGFTIDFPGAICDGTKMYVFYNVTFDEWEAFDSDDHFYLNPDETIDGIGNSKVKSEGRGINGKFERIDGKYVYSGVVTLGNLDTVTDDVFSINFTYLRNSKSFLNHPIRQFDFDITLDIPLTGDMDKFNKTVEVPTAPHVDLAQYGDWDINSIKITPLALTVDMTSDHETPDPEVLKKFWVQVPVMITFTDGSVLDITGYSGNLSLNGADRTFKYENWILYPIDVDNIETVQIAGAVIDMDGNVTMVDPPHIDVIG